MAQQFSDDARIRKYLLGDLSEAACEEIETLLLTDKEFSEQLSFARTEMIDDYVAANLSAQESEEFERHFLSTPEHFQIVEISRALAKRLEERSWDLAITPTAAPKTPTPYYIRHMKAIVLLTAGMILLLTGYVVWEVVKQKGFDNSVNDAHEQRAILKNEVVKLNRPAAGSSQDAYAVVALDLKPILVRDLGENRSVAVSKDPRILELRLELLTDKYQIYRASLQTDQGDELAVIDALTTESSNNGKVVVKLPSWLMRPGSYQIKLTGASMSGQYEDVSVYPFELTK